MSAAALASQVVADPGGDVVVAQNIAFGIIAALMIVAALRVVTTKNVVHAALYLVIVLAGVAAQFLLLGAEFTWVYANLYGSRRDQPKTERTLEAGAPEVPTRSETDPDAEEPAQRLPPHAASAAAVAPYGAAPFANPAFAETEVERDAANAATSLTTAPATPIAHVHVLPTSRAASLLRDKRVVAVAITTATVVGIAARLGAGQRLVRALSRRGPQRRLA